MAKRRTRVKGGDAQRGRAAKILRERLRGDGKLVSPTPSGERKISEVLLEFSNPLLDVFRRERRVTKRDFELALQLTTLLWNAALLPNGSEFLRGALEPFLLGDGRPAGAVRELSGVVDELIDRRRTTYAHDRRLIGDFQVEPGGTGEMRVSVACAAKPVPVL